MVSLATGVTGNYGPFVLKPALADAGCCYQITFEGVLNYSGVGHADVDIAGPAFKNACGDFGGGSIHIGQTFPAPSPIFVSGTYYVCDFTDFTIAIFNGFSGAMSGTISWSISLADPAGCP